MPVPAPVMPGVEDVAWNVVWNGLESPIGLANAGDGSDRLFILEQPGRIRIYQDGSLVAAPFLDLTDRVSCCGERGLLGLAFHPRYAENGYFYVNYTTQAGDTLTTIIARFQVSGDPLRAESSSQKQLLRVTQPYANHNGGGLAFGPDGYLYIALGDGGSAGDPQGNAQSLDTLLGKLLRVDVDHGDPYAIPVDNPFAAGGGLPEIWAYGLRNPWRFSFDRLTGDLYIGDVGQGEWEEIDYLPAGSPGGTNFGWDYYEGTQPYEGMPPADLPLTMPVAEYPHGPDVSVTGGVVYRGEALPAWKGVYLYGDYASGRVRGLLPLPDGSWQNELLFELDALITSFGEDEAGEVYLTDYQGRLLRLDASAGQASRPSAPSSVIFGVLGDYGMDNEAEAQVASLLLSWQPDLILTTGDNNYPYGSASTIDQNIGKYFHSFISPYLGEYGQGARVNRYFPTIGNHDWITDAGQPYLDYFSLPGNERYYDFVWGPVHFFAVNNESNEPDGVHNTSIQGQWLKESLAASETPWQVVYMHYPAYSSGYHGSTSWAQWPFAEWGADAVLAGHDHTYERLIVDGIPYFVVGLGGAAIYEFVNILPQSVMRYNRSFGALWAWASETQLAFRFFTMDGEIIDIFEIKR
jgi:glucose/arabinose dehydrogenase